MKSQSGFTLIELVVVIVVLGILAAVAVPKYIDLESDAREAAVKGVAGGLASASALNYAAKVTKKTNVSTVAGCDETVASNLLQGTFDSDTYSVASSAAATYASNGDTIICTLTDDASTAATKPTANFALIYSDGL